MAANTVPIFCKAPQVNWGTIATANTAKDGTGTVVTVFTADATNGGYVQRMICRAAGTNVATVIRVFINNGSTNATAGNNTLIAEYTLAATTLSEVAALANYEIPLNIVLEPGFKLNVTIGTTVAAGYAITTVGGKY